MTENLFGKPDSLGWSEILLVLIIINCIFTTNRKLYFLVLFSFIFCDNHDFSNIYLYSYSWTKCFTDIIPYTPPLPWLQHSCCNYDHHWYTLLIYFFPEHLIPCDKAFVYSLFALALTTFPHPTHLQPPPQLSLPWTVCIITAWLFKWSLTIFGLEYASNNHFYMLFPCSAIKVVIYEGSRSYKNTHIKILI